MMMRKMFGARIEKESMYEKVGTSRRNGVNRNGESSFKKLYIGKQKKRTFKETMGGGSEVLFEGISEELKKVHC